MGVYVKGMGMPKNHNHVTITIWPNGTASYTLHDRGESLVDFRNVEVVPIPPHGRLIDADILVAKCDDPYWCVWLSDIDDAPTVIPAELTKEET